ncbi:MAG TPA: hypothetical protein GX699_10160 [Firmicutes bacterium]|nr:hypothetical protein [Bacillota bacterium]
MHNNPDLSPLLSLLGSEEMKESINRVGRLLETRSAEKAASAYPGRDALVGHADPRINLLLAITPFLSTEKRSKVEALIKPLNVMFFLRHFLALTDREDGN